MARFIDDNVLAQVNSIIYLKSQDIVNHVFYSKDIIQELLIQIKNNQDVQKKHDAIEFFMEVCQLSKNTSLMTRFSFMDNTDAVSLIEVLAEIFNICEPSIQTLKAEVSGNAEMYRQLLHQTSNDFLIDDFIKKHEKFDIRKIDLLKISSLEILMSLI